MDIAVKGGRMVGVRGRAARAFLKGAPYTPAHEEPSQDYPLLYTTGRTVYHFHTRTKTGRSRDLNTAAPDAWVELSAVDAQARGITEGDWVRVESPRGAIEVRARVGNVTDGAVFAPFHYGHWEPEGPARSDPARTGVGHRAAHQRLANELTMTVWDPVSKQPTFKTAACQVTRVRRGDGPRPCADHDSLSTDRRRRPSTSTGAAGNDGWWPDREQGAAARTRLSARPRPALEQGPLMPHLTTYVGLADHGEKTLADSFRAVAEGHAHAADVFHTCHLLAGWSDGHREALAPVIDRYGEADDVHEPERLLHAASPRRARVRSVCCGTCRTCTCSPRSCRRRGR